MNTFIYSSTKRKHIKTLKTKQRKIKHVDIQSKLKKLFITIFVGNLNMKNEEFKSRSIEANDFVKSPFEYILSFGDYGCTRVTFESSLVDSTIIRVVSLLSDVIFA